MVWAPWRSRESCPLVVSMIDSTHWLHAAELAEPRLLALSVGAEEDRAQLAHERLKVRTGEALVGDHRVALQLDPGKHLGRDLALGGVCWRQLEGNRHPVGRAEQIEPKTPEVATVAGAISVGGVAGELASLHGLPRGADRDRSGVKQSDAVAPRRRGEGDRVQEPDDLRRQCPHPLVVAGLLGQVGEQVREVGVGEAQEAPLGGDVEQHLGDGQAGQLGVGDPRVSPCARPAWQEFVREDVKCGQKGVKVGGHEATSVVDVGDSNADLRRPFYVPSAGSAHKRGTESVI